MWKKERKNQKERRFFWYQNMELRGFLSRSKAATLAVLLTLSMGLTSCGDGSSSLNPDIDGVDGPYVNLVQDNVLISMVVENLEIEGGLRYAIPKYKNSYLEVSPEFSGGTLVSFSISLDDMFGADVNKMDPMTLPGGRALPGVRQGYLPAVAFSIPEFKNLGLYLGPEVFGVFVPVSQLEAIGSSILTFNFYSGDDRIGTVSAVGVDSSGQNSGILVMLNVGKFYQRKLERISKRY